MLQKCDILVHDLPHPSADEVLPHGDLLPTGILRAGKKPADEFNPESLSD